MRDKRTATFAVVERERAAVVPISALRVPLVNQARIRAASPRTPAIVP
jgi:hypothetical protein